MGFTRFRGRLVELRVLPLFRCSRNRGRPTACQRALERATVMTSDLGSCYERVNEDYAI